MLSIANENEIGAMLSWLGLCNVLGCNKSSSSYVIYDTVSLYYYDASSSLVLSFTILKHISNLEKSDPLNDSWCNLEKMYIVLEGSKNF